MCHERAVGGIQQRSVIGAVHSAKYEAVPHVDSILIYLVCGMTQSPFIMQVLSCVVLPSYKVALAMVTVWRLQKNLHILKGVCGSGGVELYIGVEGGDNLRCCKARNVNVKTPGKVGAVAVHIRPAGGQHIHRGTRQQHRRFPHFCHVRINTGVPGFCRGGMKAISLCA